MVHEGPGQDCEWLNLVFRRAFWIMDGQAQTQDISVSGCSPLKACIAGTLCSCWSSAGVWRVCIITCVCICCLLMQSRVWFACELTESEKGQPAWKPKRNPFIQSLSASRCNAGHRRIDRARTPIPEIQNFGRERLP
ncbi:hypothetical protein BJX63DRAFT_385346 [Aspergillus granulosus]|uniref:Uncharacterized protein n=1 Tax=Aspergillus granulosus TaxID=176169 RepID=A0ABR4HQA8_9EURO